jgi:hypothetical protein
MNSISAMSCSPLVLSNLMVLTSGRSGGTNLHKIDLGGVYQKHQSRIVKVGGLPCLLKPTTT